MTLKSFIAAGALAAASFGSQAAQLALDLIDAPRPGESFAVQLRLVDPFAGLAANEQLLAFGFHLDYDSSLLAFEAFTPAAGWDDDSAHLASGVFSASTFPGLTNAGQGSVLLATLRFDSLGSAASTIRLSSDAADFNQGLTYLYADPSPLGASIAVSPVPEPASYLLMAGGLIGIAAWRRRRGAHTRTHRG